MDSLILDTRQAFRSFRHARGFSIVAVLSLSLGIAACTTIFSALQPVVLRALPFPEIERLVKLGAREKLLESRCLDIRVAEPERADRFA